MIRTNKAPLLPPRGIFVSTRLLFDNTMSPHLKNSLFQLMALAWRSDQHITPKLTYRILVKVMAKDERTIRGHLTLLRSYHAALRLRFAESGQFYVIFANWLYRNDGPRESPVDFGRDGPSIVEDGKRIPLVDQLRKNQNQEEEEVFNPELPPPPDDLDLDPWSSTYATPGDAPLDWDNTLAEEWLEANAGSETGEAEEDLEAQVIPPIPEDLSKQLLEAGLFPELLREVARRADRDGYTPDELRALLDWSKADPVRRPAGLFIYRLRKSMRAPAEYLEPLCPRCGQRGKHAPGCPRGYTADF